MGRASVQRGEGGLLQIVWANGDSKVAWHSLEPELDFGQLTGVAVDAEGRIAVTLDKTLCTDGVHAALSEATFPNPKMRDL